MLESLKQDLILLSTTSKAARQWRHRLRGTRPAASLARPKQPKRGDGSAGEVEGGGGGGGGVGGGQLVRASIEPPDEMIHAWQQGQTGELSEVSSHRYVSNLSFASTTSQNMADDEGFRNDEMKNMSTSGYLPNLKDRSNNSRRRYSLPEYASGTPLRRASIPTSIRTLESVDEGDMYDEKRESMAASLQMMGDNTRKQYVNKKPPRRRYNKSSTVEVRLMETNDIRRGSLTSRLVETAKLPNIRSRRSSVSVQSELSAISEVRKVGVTRTTISSKKKKDDGPLGVLSEVTSRPSRSPTRRRRSSEGYIPELYGTVKKACMKDKLRRGRVSCVLIAIHLVKYVTM